MPKPQLFKPATAPISDQDPTYRSCIVLTNAHRSCTNFLSIFDKATANRGPGSPSDQDQDVLRAMLLFACAGLDAAVSHLMRDCAKSILPRSQKLQAEVETFVRKKLGSELEGTKYLLKMLRESNTPIDDLVVADLIQSLTEHSLQSHAELLRLCSYFEIDENPLKKDIIDLRKVFQARNLVAHEMDINFEPSNRSRTVRRRDEMVEFTNQVIKVANDLIAATRSKLATKTVDPK